MLCYRCVTTGFVQNHPRNIQGSPWHLIDLSPRRGGRYWPPVNRYSYAVDHEDWIAFDQVFAPDAIVDYTLSPAGRCYTVDELRKSIEEAISTSVLSTQHIVGNTIVCTDGKAGSAISKLILTTLRTTGQGGELEQYSVSGTLFDELTGTNSGWRIEHRTLLATSEESSEVDDDPRQRAFMDRSRDALKTRRTDPREQLGEMA